MKRTLTYLTLALFSYAVIVVGILDNHHVIVRRVAILCESLFGTVAILIVAVFVILWRWFFGLRISRASDCCKLLVLFQSGSVACFGCAWCCQKYFRGD